MSRWWHYGRVPKSLPTIDMSGPVCCAPVASGPMSDADALQGSIRMVEAMEQIAEAVTKLGEAGKR